MWVGFRMARVTELWIPPRLPEVSAPGTFTIFSCAWYIKIMVSGIRWLTTARAAMVPLALNTSTQSLSTMPAFLASISLIHTLGPPRNKVSMRKLSL